ncbi:hypothetical protein [Halorubrum sp. DTA46]|uniref:hypothetical protein n=1 Tax=Halorubrum sp. DTA46 TaxID=3402162 RepID=UPI003AAEB746
MSDTTDTPMSVFGGDCPHCSIAAEGLADRAGTLGTVGGLVRDNYDRTPSVVGTLSGRGRDPNDFHETCDLTDEAATPVGALRPVASEPPTPAPYL